VAYGAEFCPRRLPEVAAAVAVARACAAAGRGFSLVTPVVRQGHLAFVQTYLERFAAQVAGAECVCNDWGVLQWVVDQQLPLRLAAGRVLSRQRRDARVLRHLQEAAPAEVLALCGSAWNDDGNLALLCALGVQRVELDCLLQGVARPNLPEGMALSLCAPWLPVTVTPACDYAENPLQCARSCREHPAVCRETEQDPHPLWSQGNTLFVRSELNPPYPGLTKLGADRLVWAETLPG